jgi:hypothetical protein
MTPSPDKMAPMQARDDADAGAQPDGSGNQTQFGARLISIISRPLSPRLVLESAFAIVVLVAMLPLNPAQVGWGLDPSWQQVVHHGFERGMQFGTDLVFTYGPFGFAHTRLYWPGLFAYTFFYWSLMALGVGFACISLARHSRANPWIFWPPLFLGVLLAGIYSTGLYAPDVFPLFLTLLLVWYVHDAQPSLAGFAALCAILGFVGLGKLTNAVFGCIGLTAAVAIFALRREWRLAAAGPVAFALAFLLGWLGAGQHIASLPSFILNGMEIVTGYKDAMTVWGSPFERTLFTLAAVLLMAGPVLRAMKSRNPTLLIACGFTGVALVIAFNQGFTRHDRYHSITAFEFLALAAATVSMHSEHSASRRIDGVMSGTAIAAAFAVLLHFQFSPPALTLFRILDLFEISARNAVDLAGGGKNLRDRHERQLEGIRSRLSYPSLPGGTYDIYSHDQAELFALGVQWSPRPVFQSYSAYTPKLAALNAAHVSGPAAADHLLFAVQPIDKRLPALDDGASWVPILERYQLREKGRHLVLDRSASPRKTRRQIVGTWHGHGWIELPPGAGLRTAAIRLDARPVSMDWYRTTPPYDAIEVKLRGSDAPRTFRFIAGPASEPFFFSPLVSDTGEFARLFDRCAAPDAANDVRAVRILDADKREIGFSIDLYDVDFIVPAVKSPGPGC